MHTDMKSKGKLYKVTFLLHWTWTRKHFWWYEKLCLQLGFIYSSVGNFTVLCRSFPVFPSFLLFGFFLTPTMSVSWYFLSTFFPIIALIGYYFPLYNSFEDCCPPFFMLEPFLHISHIWFMTETFISSPELIK